MPQSNLSNAAASVVAAMPHAIWRADQIASFKSPSMATGFPDLDRELPDGGWPRSSLVEVLVQQHGVGELQVLAPALAPMTCGRRLALVAPPHSPQTLALLNLGLRLEHVVQIRSKSSANALWSAEQILLAGDAFGAVVMWQTNIRPESLRRLHLAAQSANTYLWMVRPLSARQDTSPAPLRIALKPAYGGVHAEIVKRRGPHCDRAIYLGLAGMPSTRHFENENAILDQRVAAVSTARRLAPDMV